MEITEIKMLHLISTLKKKIWQETIDRDHYAR
jgi:hypothetical protein